MAYSKDARELALKYISKGYSYEEAHKELGVSARSMKAWKGLMDETGSLERSGQERSQGQNSLPKNLKHASKNIPMWCFQI
jgi:Transposase and inactivated derivatives